LYFRSTYIIMTVHYQIEDLPLFTNAVITIGTFDGVHTGHQQIIRQLTEETKKVGGESVIITFDPHPRKILGNPAREIKLLNTTEEKIELLGNKGIDHLVIVPFTLEFSQLTAEEYIRDFLVSKFRPHTIIIGYDHRFGQGRKGDYQLLEEFSSLCNYRLLEIPVHVLNAISVSSTRIREAITATDIEVANHLLGYDFFFEGVVSEGNKLGRTIGYPTANLSIINPEKIIPGNGVYAVTLSIARQVELGVGESAYPAFVAGGAGEAAGRFLKGMMNIGNRPTLGGGLRTIEVNIFDFDEDIYGVLMRVVLKHHIRAEKKMEGLGALKEQLARDKLRVISLLG
jgi:riboflavin kinase / FMN adenylyltransferase